MHMQVERHHAGAEMIDDIAQHGGIGFLDLAAGAQDDAAIAVMGEAEGFTAALLAFLAWLHAGVADGAGDGAVLHITPAFDSFSITSRCIFRNWSRSGTCGCPWLSIWLPVWKLSAAAA